MLPPIGVLAFYKYYQSGSFNLEIEGPDSRKQTTYLCINNGCFFYDWGWLGAKWSLKTPVHIVKLVFGSFMLYASIKMILSGINHYLK